MQKILTLNAGSSSIKVAVFDVEAGRLIEEPCLRGNLNDIDGIPSFAASDSRGGRGTETLRPNGICDHETAWDFLIGWLEEAMTGAEVTGAGHRVVHGGPDFSAPVRLNEEIMRRLTALTPLAPGHQPHNLAGVTAIAHCCPIARQVACFDTAFHRSQPRIEQIFALPRKFSEDGIIRYGFHGLSYQYIAGALAGVLEGYPRKRVIVAHLGAGASMCAMVDGKSVATTMGFTALDGLPMATRCGAIDPGVVLHLMEEKKMSATEVADCLYKESGLRGLSDISGDMRVLEASEAPEAAEAIDYFVRRAAREIGSLAAAMGGVDALVFTAGVGENSCYIRERILSESAWLGFLLDKDANRESRTRLTVEESTPSAWVIPTNEELMIARQVYELTRNSD